MKRNLKKKSPRAHPTVILPPKFVEASRVKETVEERDRRVEVVESNTNGEIDISKNVGKTELPDSPCNMVRQS
jgi:hypothetical protein